MPRPAWGGPAGWRSGRLTTSVWLPSLIIFGHFKDMVYPFFESDTLFLECFVVLLLVVLRFFEPRDVSTVPSNSMLGIPIFSCSSSCPWRQWAHQPRVRFTYHAAPACGWQALTSRCKLVLAFGRVCEPSAGV